MALKEVMFLLNLCYFLALNSNSCKHSQRFSNHMDSVDFFCRNSKKRPLVQQLTLAYFNVRRMRIIWKKKQNFIKDKNFYYWSALGESNFCAEYRARMLTLVRDLLETNVDAFLLLCKKDVFERVCSYTNSGYYSISNWKNQKKYPLI